MLADERIETGQASENKCISCGTASPDRSDNPYSQLCPDCRQRLIRRPFPKWLFAVLAAVLAANAACYLLFPHLFRDLSRMAAAERHNAQKHYLLAEREYTQLSTEYPTNESLVEKELDAMMAAGDLNGAVKLINGHYVNKSLDQALYDKVTGYQDTLDRYSKASDKLYNALGDNPAPDETSLKKLEAQLGDAYTDPVILEQIAVLELNLGDSAAALQYAQEAAASNYRFPDAYDTLAYIKRYSRDYAGARQALSQALDKNMDDVEAHRQLAVLGFLERNYAQALKEASTAYDLDSSVLYVREALAIACHLTSDTARHDTILAEMKKAGDDTSSVEALIAGQTTPEEIYLK